MQTDDVYRARLQRAIADIKLWALKIASVAKVLESDDAFSWRLVVEPPVPGCCPIELMLRIVDDQALYDIRIAGEGYEDRAIEDFDVFLPILEAAAAGQVWQRQWTSPITGMPVALETVVIGPDDELWKIERLQSDTVDTAGLFKTTAHYVDRRFLPYGHEAV